MPVRECPRRDAANLRPIGVLARAVLGLGLLFTVAQPLRAGDASQHEKEVRQATESLKKAGAYVVARAGDPTAVMIVREIDRRTLGLLAKLDRVAYLTLAGDWVIDASLEELPALPQLQSLAIRSHGVGDRGLAVLSRWQTLKNLSLSQLSITDEGLAGLAGLTELESLEVADTLITGAGLRHLHLLPKLWSVVLDDNRLQEAELAQLAKLKGLRTLEVHDHALSDRAVPYLKQLRGLHRLLLRRTQITDAGIDQLRQTLPGAEIVGGSLAVSQEKLSRIGIAVHDYHSQYGHFPPAVLTGPDGKTTFSWRVALLPFLGAERLFAQYRLDQPWDSPANRKVLDQMPDVYREPKPATVSSIAASAASSATAFLAVTGPRTAFAGKEGTAIRQLADGTTNVVMLVEARSGIPWTRPDDLSRESGSLPKLEAVYSEGFNALMADGQPRWFRLPFKDEKALRELLRQSVFALNEQNLSREMIGKPAPGFTLNDLQGKPVTFAPLVARKAALIVFTGARCPPCRVEAPHLAELYRRHQNEGLVILAVNPMDEPADLVRQCAEKEKPPFPTLLDGRSVAQGAYHILASPTTYFVNRDGIIAAIHTGFAPGDERLLERATAELLKGQQRSPH
jgi:peroxiredoxin